MGAGRLVGARDLAARDLEAKDPEGSSGGDQCLRTGTHIPGADSMSARSSTQFPAKQCLLDSVGVKQQQQHKPIGPKMPARTDLDIVLRVTLVQVVPARGVHLAGHHKISQNISKYLRSFRRT
eukprot:SAG31_NODE_329_length_17643_cov_10.377793_5_plen_123_part_00